VLIVVAILMLVGYQYLRLMGAELEATAASNRVTQSRYLADSGLHYTAFVLAYPQTAGISDGADSLLAAPGLIYDNPDVFHLRPVTVGQGRRTGFFSIVSPRDLDDPMYLDQGFRFGVEDEGGKINLNAILRLGQQDQQRVREMLTKLPEMTEELADSILNWIRASNNNSGENTDDMHYATMGYAAKHGPLESLEELLLVRGFTPRLLLGNDLNRNRRLESQEDDLGGFLDPGLSRYLTIYSRERNVDAQGQPRINLNDTDLATLWDRLNEAVGEELANFIIGWRLNSQQQGAVRIQIRLSASDQTLSTALVWADDSRNLDVVSDGILVMADGSARQIGQQPAAPKEYGTLTKADLGDLSRQAQRNVESIYDLIATAERDVEFPITRREGRREITTYYRSPLSKEDLTALRELLPLLFDKTTTRTEMELPARVNINTAPREVLLAFPNIAEDLVQDILDLRPGPDMDQGQAALYRTPAWLITEADLDPQVVKPFEPYITTRSQVYRVQVVGYYELGAPAVRLEAVIDTNGGRPRFLYWRDITELGRGFNLTGIGMIP
jgi:DNA uptake protein ComE-like DNA-binding protein